MAPHSNDSGQILPVGLRIRERRWVELGYTLQDVAAHIGVSDSLLSEMEHGSAQFTEYNLWKLSILLGLDYLTLRDQASEEGSLTLQTGQVTDWMLQLPMNPTPLPSMPDPVRELPLDLKGREWLTVQEAARLLDRTPSSVTGLIRQGLLQPAKLEAAPYPANRKWWIKADAILTLPRKTASGYKRPASYAPRGMISVNELAQLTDTPLATVRRLIKQGVIETQRRGQRVWVSRKQVAVINQYRTRQK